MSTRAVIGKIEKEGVRAIYCHNDGYIERSGSILFKNYHQPEHVDALLELGDLSILDVSIGEKHYFESRCEGACTAYGRDRGEEGTEATLCKDLDALIKYAKDSGAEYIYLYVKDRWLVSAGDERFCCLERELNLRGC